MRLIDADRRITVTYYDEEHEEWSQKTRTIWDTILEVGDEIPPVVDAVPVVRCRNCTWFDSPRVCLRHGRFVENRNWFCADGEKRNVENS